MHDHLDERMGELLRDTLEYLEARDVRNQGHVEARTRLIQAYETRMLRKTVETYGVMMVEAIRER